MNYIQDFNEATNSFPVCIDRVYFNNSGEQKPKRNRTAFTKDQLKELEKNYKINRKISQKDRNELASKLELQERVIKVWFQNQRMKEKNKKQSDSNEPSGHEDILEQEEQTFQPPNNGQFYTEVILNNSLEAEQFEIDSMIIEEMDIEVEVEALHEEQEIHQSSSSYEQNFQPPNNGQSSADDQLSNSSVEDQFDLDSFLANL
ncbi:homeobox protein Hox-A2-like [Contarinia nasturtii]|uniref:homeobox protein Hox-A2-like n=1 Tax=Contarinia nasturtii TaxID=265458 RepID=UPI0012D4BA22|nr:homeobox protein Hox-A2-like [Contarinia nasturtii]